MLDLEPFEEIHVVIFESLFGVMLFLIKKRYVTLRERSPRPKSLGTN